MLHSALVVTILYEFIDLIVWKLAADCPWWMLRVFIHRFVGERINIDPSLMSSGNSWGIEGWAATNIGALTEKEYNIYRRIARSTNTYEYSTQRCIMTSFSHHYQAILARNPFGYLLTKNFLVSSHNTSPAPKPNATISISSESRLTNEPILHLWSSCIEDPLEEWSQEEQQHHRQCNRHCSKNIQVPRFLRANRWLLNNWQTSSSYHE